MSTRGAASRITDALRDVVDPELGMSVVDLGLIYRVDVAGGDVAITMTLTAAGCPLHTVMADWVRAAAARVPGVERVTVEVTFDPPWTPERIHR
jgi:metal-sulfur cluster biosynthetic enzyme